MAIVVLRRVNKNSRETANSRKSCLVNRKREIDLNPELFAIEQSLRSESRDEDEVEQTVIGG